MRIDRVRNFDELPLTAEGGCTGLE